MHQPIVRHFPAVRDHHVKARTAFKQDDAVESNFTLTGPVTITQVVSVITLPTAVHQHNPSQSSPPSTSSNLVSPSEPTTTSSDTSIYSSPTVTATDNVSVPSDTDFPSGAIVGMVIVAVLSLLGLAFFLTRNRFIRNRKRRRPGWGAPIMNVPGWGAPIANVPDTSSEVLLNRGHVSIHEKLPGVTLPPLSYNSVASTVTVGKGMTGPSKPLSQTSAKVKSTFIPTLPDELSLTMGEVLRVLSEYDDGWVLCENRMGEQGMVPLDCLDRYDEVQDHRLSRRASSLAPKRC